MGACRSAPPDTSFLRRASRRPRGGRSWRGRRGGRGRVVLRPRDGGCRVLSAAGPGEGRLDRLRCRTRGARRARGGDLSRAREPGISGRHTAVLPAPHAGARAEPARLLGGRRGRAQERRRRGAARPRSGRPPSPHSLDARLGTAPPRRSRDVSARGVTWPGGCAKARAEIDHAARSLLEREHRALRALDRRGRDLGRSRARSLPRGTDPAASKTRGGKEPRVTRGEGHPARTARRSLAGCERGFARRSSDEARTTLRKTSA